VFEGCGEGDKEGRMWGICGEGRVGGRDNLCVKRSSRVEWKGVESYGGKKGG